MTTIAHLVVGEDRVAAYDDGSGVDAAWGPRPFLHPVTTRAGVPVTDALPEDHRWHLGVSVALQDVDGTNFWGGRTYRRDDGYQWRDDHGRVRHVDFPESSPHGWAELLDWVDRTGVSVLSEERRVSATPCACPDAWCLGLGFTLTNVTDRPVRLGSPATNGRERAGYGGFFWRLPPHAGDLDVFTSAASGEADVHGSTEPWVAASATDPAGRPWTVLLEHDGPAGSTAPDPWFVRVEGYPGVGSSLAWSRPVELAPGASASRGFRATIVDTASGRPEDVDRWLGQARRRDGTRGE